VKKDGEDWIQIHEDAARKGYAEHAHEVNGIIEA
jgi:2-iminoacetate synthase ThiH